MKYSLGKLSEACGDREVARDLENDEHVSLEAKVSPFPFTFFNLSGFTIINGVDNVNWPPYRDSKS